MKSKLPALFPSIDNKFKLVILLLILGAVYRLIFTWNGNFIFNMDNARDMLDVREMVVLQKSRLIGPTSGLEGIYNGPGWYYLIAIPFIISSGNPYSSVVLMISLWFIGGIFIYKLMDKYNHLPRLTVIAVWVSSNYVILANLYAYNPNPVILLTPLLIYLMERSLSLKSLKFSLLTGFLGGLFFNLEMAFGLFIPFVIIIYSVIINKEYLKSKNFFYGAAVFILTLLPQAFFYLKNWPLLLGSISKFSGEGGVGELVFHPLTRFSKIESLYLNVLSGTMMNWKPLVFLTFLGILFLTFKIFSSKAFRQDRILVITLLFVLIPFFGSLILPFDFMPWHLGGQMAAVIILLGLFLYYLGRLNYIFRLISLVGASVIIVYSLINLDLKNNILQRRVNNNATIFTNEIEAIDYVYQQAKGKNFKVYVYLPSVYDYPYQYLFWWYGQRKYGYLPEEYTYLPDKPSYVRNKEKFSNGVKPPSSNLVFLIKQPDQRGERHLWENSFSHFAPSSTSQIGSIEIETRKVLDK